MGSVFRDKRTHPHVWAIRYKDVLGQFRRERTKAKTKTLAKRILSSKEDAVEQARHLGLKSVEEFLKPKSAITLQVFSKEFLAHVKAQLAPKTVERYEGMLRKHILPTLGRLALPSVNPGHVQRYADSRMEKAAPATVCQELMLLSGVFREAWKRDYVEKNPVSKVKKPRIENLIVRFLEKHEEKRLLAFASPQLRPVIVTAIHTGLRESELRNLTWADVHFDRKQLLIRKTKSKKDRIVPMNETVCATLDELPRYTESPYVFTNSRTRNRYKFAFNNSGWRDALKRAGIRSFRFHDLRHTFGSRLAQAGVPIATIKELMGHSSIQVTLRYAHLSPSNLLSAVKVLDEDSGKVDLKSTHKSTHGAKSGTKSEKVS